jgi:hypothetical protein
MHRQNISNFTKFAMHLRDRDAPAKAAKEKARRRDDLARFITKAAKHPSKPASKATTALMASTGMGDALKRALRAQSDIRKSVSLKVG